MTEVIKLVADAVVKTRESFIKCPEIYLIFNMVAEIKQKSIDECVSKL